MQCPNCGFNADPKDTFCEKCGIVFADYQLLQTRQAQKQTLEQQTTVQKIQIDPVQQGLASTYLCNSEDCLPVVTPATPELAKPASVVNSEQSTKKPIIPTFVWVIFFSVIGIFALYYFLI